MHSEMQCFSCFCRLHRIDCGKKDSFDVDDFARRLVFSIFMMSEKRLVFLLYKNFRALDGDCGQTTDALICPYSSVPTEVGTQSPRQR